jgi:malate synthase
MRTFEVLAWTESGGFVLYVPEVEALTRARQLDELEAAARDLVAELLGLEPGTIGITLRFERPRP